MPHRLPTSSLPECRDDQDNGSSTDKVQVQKLKLDTFIIGGSGTKIKVRYFHNWRLYLIFGLDMYLLDLYRKMPGRSHKKLLTELISRE